ncbi:MAG: hypothetical protein ACK59C_04520 [Holosporales bacterium]
MAATMTAPTAPGMQGSGIPEWYRVAEQALSAGIPELNEKMKASLQKMMAFFDKAKEHSANALEYVPDESEIDDAISIGFRKGKEEARKKAAERRKRSWENVGDLTKTVLMFGAVTAAVVLIGPGVWAMLGAVFAKGATLGSVAGAFKLASFHAVAVAGLTGLGLGAAKATFMDGDTGQALKDFTSSFDTKGIKDSTQEQITGEKIKEASNRVTSTFQNVGANAQESAANRNLAATLVNSNSGFSAPAQATAASPSYEELLISLFNSTNLNDPALLDKIPDNAFNNTTTGFALLQRTTHVLTQYAENEIRDKIDELSQNLDPDVFYPLLIELEKKAKSINPTSQLGQILKVCTDRGKKLREGAMVEAVEMINNNANVNPARLDDVLGGLQALRYLGVFKYTGRNTQIDDEVLEPGSPLRKKLMEIIMNTNTNTGPDFTALDTLINYNNPSITGQESKDLKQLQEIAQRTAYIAEGKQAADLLNALQAEIDTWAAAGSAAGSNGTVPSTQPIINALDALENAGYLAYNTTSSMWYIPPHKLVGNNGDNVMLRALEQQYIEVNAGNNPPLMKHGLVDPNTLTNANGQLSTPFSLTTELQASNPNHLAKLNVLQQHIISQRTLLVQWLSGQNLPTP